MNVLDVGAALAKLSAASTSKASYKTGGRVMKWSLVILLAN